jgi:hypothetical protein
MKPHLRLLFLIPVIGVITSCHTINTMQSTVVKKFAVTSKEVSDLPYKILFSYYSIKFKRKQLLPENYVIGDTTKEYLDSLPGEVMMTIEDMREAYYSNIRTANKIKTVYQLLETYINSLEALASDKFSRDFEKRSDEIGKKMNGLISGFNASPGKKIPLPLNPGEWLTSLATMHGRSKIKTMQAKFLKDYINQADTFVQAINRNYQEIQMNDMTDWFKEEKDALNEQFKRIIAIYLQNLSRHPENSTTMVAFEFYSKINPVYYELTDEIYRNEELIKQTSLMMNNLARTHSSMKAMFNDGNNWLSVAEEVEGMKEKLFIIKDLFNKEGQEKFSFYKNFIMQNENSVKNILDKH